MPVACPVCATEHADVIHLANHLAVTASLGRDDHVDWLDEHAPDWPDRGPAELGAVVAERVETIDPADVDALSDSNDSSEIDRSGHLDSSARHSLIDRFDHRSTTGVDPTAETDLTRSVLETARAWTEQRRRKGASDDAVRTHSGEPAPSTDSGEPKDSTDGS